MADGGYQAADKADEIALPHNIEAEQALLGALLVNNEIYDKVAAIVEPVHFYDPVHRRIYDVAAQRIQKNALASPVTLKAFLADDPGLAELGGPAYLARLAGAAISIFAARDYAQMIYDLAIRRALIEIGEEIAGTAKSITVDNEPKAQIVEAEARLYQLAEQGRVEGGFQSFLRSLTTAVNVANSAYQREGKLAGVSTGLRDLDSKLGGLHKSDLLILAGRPSMGKTALATNLAFNVANAYKKGMRSDGVEGTIDGGVVGFFSLEMSADQLASRILAEQAEVDSHKIRDGSLDADEFRRFIEASKTLERIPLYIDDTPALKISTVAARARRLKRQHGLDLLVIDYLQLLKGTNAKSDNRVNEVSEITQGLKAIAKELEIPVIALSQLSRQVENREDKRPQLSDLRESGSIEQDADAVMFVYREEYYKEREMPSETDLEATARWQELMEQVTGKAEVIIGKQRHGPIGSVQLAFEGRFTRFSDLAQSWQQRPDDY
ncbi:replicative DNA helicase [Pontivivens nitratireducens]|uniref:Replicative DNA helicase n=1 Tax=Pontivivens nitratireducens TaxID=2758038 RepID=A0A6G7VQB7_9RHOB|nr:replicative DNA helicase [Pontibrevibacter nitratireducens]QIK42112.1 replicative DNA helicase [Pontibrevibacter nitratireducens]